MSHLLKKREETLLTVSEKVILDQIPPPPPPTTWSSRALNVNAGCSRCLHNVHVLLAVFGSLASLRHCVAISVMIRVGGPLGDTSCMYACVHVWSGSSKEPQVHSGACNSAKRDFTVCNHRAICQERRFSTVPLQRGGGRIFRGMNM